jgi:UDP-N-acetylmuramyl tripeptide synthase
MKLSQLIHTDEAERIDNFSPGVADAPDPAGFATNPDVTSIHYRSNDVRPGGMFFALKGQHTDGHRYIRDAVSRGAAVIVVDAPLLILLSIFCWKAVWMWG